MCLAYHPAQRDLVLRLVQPVRLDRIFQIVQVFQVNHPGRFALEFQADQLILAVHLYHFCRLRRLVRPYRLDQVDLCKTNNNTSNLLYFKYWLRKLIFKHNYYLVVQIHQVDHLARLCHFVREFQQILFI